MKKKWLFCALMAGTILNSSEIVHVQHNDPDIKSGAVSEETMTKKISQVAIEYERFAPIPRFAMYDCAFASDINEFKRLNTYGVIMISSINQDESEHPLSAVYFYGEDEELVLLQLIGKIQIDVRDELTKKVFGTNRIDYYYLIPYYVTMKKGMLLLDWNKNRKQFFLVKYPASNKLKFFDQGEMPVKDKQIEKNDLNTFMKREYMIQFK